MQRKRKYRKKTNMENFTNTIEKYGTRTIAERNWNERGKNPSSDKVERK